MLVNAYYFRAQMYTLVPHQVRQDMQWMADAGTKVVSLAVLEQDLFAARENIEILAEQAQRVGMELWAVPSRWGGLVAGAPKVPSLFSASHPETWILRPDGRPSLSKVCGPASSVHHPATYEFFAESLRQLLDLPFSGIIWDEVKPFGICDCSQAARAALGDGAPVERHTRAVAEFFGRISRHAQSLRPASHLPVSLFLYAGLDESIVETFAAQEGLDYFGCDGRPWSAHDGGVLEGAGKTLVDNGPAFLRAARRHGKKSLLLVENHNMTEADTDRMDAHLPKVLALAPDQLLYYYYPRNLRDPDRNMAVLARHLRTLPR